jgi:hypothetical protein
MLLLTKYFKISDERGKDIIIKAYGPNNCSTVHSDYLTEHESTDNRVVGKDIKQGLVLVAGYGYYPTFGPYVKDQGKYFYNTWRPANDLFGRQQFEAYVHDGYKAYNKALAIKPDYGNAKHLLASLTGETTNSAPREYVEKLFDGYANKFDN